MALSRTVVRTIAFNRRDPGPTLERANGIIWNDTTSDLFVTAFYANWEPYKEQLTYANAGHNPPLLLRRSGKSQLLRGDGMAMGVLEKIHISQQAVRLHPGDTVIFYTDGVTEAVNEDYDEFGLERLRLAAQKAQNREAAGIMAAITSAIRDFAGDTPQSDDVTLIVMKRHA
jgi:phosphoserine phosphatase RsbU/P